MNPILAQAIAEAEQKGLTLLLESVGIFMKDVLAGKSPAEAADDLAMSLAEKQALALDKVLG